MISRVRALAAVAVALTLAACGSAASSQPAAAPSAPASAQREATILVEGVVELRNDWNSKVLVRVKDVANFDWEGNQRPDHRAPDGFQDVWLEPGQSARATLSPNPFANGSPFTLVWGDTNVTTRLQSLWQDVGVTSALAGWTLTPGDCPSTHDTVTNGWRVTVTCSGVYANPRTTVTLSAA